MALNAMTAHRIQAIDFTKGILVILMVIYHTLNVYKIFPHRFMAFLPASFIMITGFIITNIYFPKYEFDIRGLRTRLAVRSLKLLFIFTGINLAALTILSKHQNDIAFQFGNFFRDWLEIYLIGNARETAFEILIPISYLLLLSIVIQTFQSLTPRIVKISTLIILTASILMDHHGSSIYNIDLIGAGVVGMTIGFLPLTTINRLAKPPIIAFSLLLLIGCYLLFSGDDYIIQIISTVISLFIIYSLGCRIDMNNWLIGQNSLLGTYSLLCYIIQIGYLQLYRIVSTRWHIEKPIILTIITVTMITWVTVILVDHGRKKYHIIDVLYKKCFA